MSNKKKPDKFYSGWAMDAYPEMTSEDMTYHVSRQIENGSNFVWIGHNNPGECQIDKIEPALSYAVWEALMDKDDPRHEDAVAIVDSQRRLLDYCLENNIPVVFPIGYQVQMGERWNKSHPDSLRQHYDGEIINWGGVSACFYSPDYQEDIQKFYSWVAETFIKDYRAIILLVNLSDEPFGGDYSKYAEVAFKKETGMTFREALEGDNASRRAAGRFQARYIVEYATWSAKAWNKVCPDIPSTMSFCGHHGREENTMPAITDLFSDTPEYFHPTFDVYPRDGDQKTPIGENDLVMLYLFLNQLAYLSNQQQKPYWLWTTGNSWGLGQGSMDRANITDALMNQTMVISSAVQNGGLLQGFAIWNYNIKCQGLYNDIYETAYKTEDMFSKLTRYIGHIRKVCDINSTRETDIAIIAERDYSHRFIARSRASTWVRPFPFDRFSLVFKQCMNPVMDDRLENLVDFLEAGKKKTPPVIYLSDGDVREAEFLSLVSFLKKKNRILMPEKLWKKLEPGGPFQAEVQVYEEDTCDLPELKIIHFLGQNQPKCDGIFHFSLGDMTFSYNLTRERRCISGFGDNGGQSVIHLAPSAEIIGQTKINDEAETMNLEHHEAAVAASDNSREFQIILDALKKGS